MRDAAACLEGQAAASGRSPAESRRASPVVGRPGEGRRQEGDYDAVTAVAPSPSVAVGSEAPFTTSV